jgi:hypothetical protein
MAQQLGLPVLAVAGEAAIVLGHGVTLVGVRVKGA